MVLYDYIKSTDEGTEITVTDHVYDIETYFYNESDIDGSWEKDMERLSKLLKVTATHVNSVSVNLSEIIERHLEQLENKDLFTVTRINSIMASIENILSGYVSEEWFTKFIDVLEGI